MWRFVLLGAVAVPLLTSCSLGEKADIARRVERSRAKDIGPQAVQIGMRIELEEAPGGFELPGAPPGFAPPEQEAGSEAPVPLAGGLWEGVVAFDSGRSAVIAPAAAAARIAGLAGAAPVAAPLLVIADRDALTVRRPAGQVVAARPWYRLQLDRAKEVTKPDAIAALTGRSAGDAAILTPTLMVDLLAGVLPGSVRVEDDGRIRGRFSFEKAAREDDLTDDEIETREHAFRLFAVTDDVHEFVVDLGPDGELRAIELALTMSPDKVTRFTLVWGMRVTGPAPAIDEPADEEIVTITSFNQARGAVNEWLGAPA